MEYSSGDILDEDSFGDVFWEKMVEKSAIFAEKYSSGDIKLRKPGPAISISVPERGVFWARVRNSVRSFSAMRRGVRVGFLRVPVSRMATLQA